MSQKKKLKNQFLANYLIVFLLVVLATAMAFALLSFASGLISGGLAKNRYPASALMKEDYREIDAAAVAASGGGIAVITGDYRIVRTEGLDTIGKSRLTPGEFSEFLLSGADKPYHYDVGYQPKGDFWLVVTFPTSLRLDFSLVTNSEAAASDRRLAYGVLAGVGVIYLFLLGLLTFGYSRLSAAAVTRPLRKLHDGTRLLREGDYSVRVDLHLKNEFAELQDTFNDMAARIERETALLEKSEADRKRLILDISHDLKNPLSSIQGYTELCLKQPDLAPEVRHEYLEVVFQNSRRADLLLRDLFELSKLESPDFAIKPRRTALCEYLRQTSAQLLPLFDKAGFTCEFDIPETEMYAMLDTGRFSRILFNLADNAVRYNKAGARVRLELAHKGDTAVIRFSDDGEGIPKALADDIFKPFVRADSARNSKTGGSGLGLAIAKKIARSHGGDLVLDPAPGKGCRFLLNVPLI